ncbi:MAG: Coenzyme F420 hydrogenase/dehydrogenase, beta subunit C-terminal domain [Mailhella sp.]|nr:Coenzyme F420 hydrogenase/dehydrogenase, beta subunit C-terminal domain [Mailhella sp.]
MEIESILCTGCTACAHACPASAISMKEDAEGFLSPVVDESLCTGCGLCRKVCPACSPSYANEEKPSCFAAMASDELRMGKSASGAAFPVLAHEFLVRGGAICGAAFRDDWSVAHILVDDLEGLERLKNSKYVQSDMGDCFPRIKAMLDAGRPVLFSGTGCQVAGLKGFLRKDYPHLCTVDILCHGVPSPGVWRRYLEENFDVSSIRNISFRTKEKPWGAESIIIMENALGQKIHQETYTQGTYYRGFGRNVILRKSCGQCQFNRLPRQADITIGDYWGIDAVRPDLNDGKGTSVILANTKKGRELLEKLHPEFKILEELPLESALPGNLNITSSTPEHENRTGFFFLARQKSATEALSFAASDISDCKIVNFWFGVNYGATLTCYALQETLFSLGKTAKVVNYMPPHWRDTREGSFSDKFSRKHLHLTRRFWDYADLATLNDVTDTFLVGSDQIFRHEYYESCGGPVFQLDFVRANKRRIACSASFGKLAYDAPAEEAERFQYNLSQFDAVSVRETPGVAIFDRMGIPAEQIIEPVFYLPQKRWHELADGHTEEHGEGVIYFSLGYQNAAEQPPILHFAAERLGVPVNVQIFDRQRSVEDWLDSIRKASFVVTDSFHGMCFAILFHRPFAVLCSYGEMRSRMDEVLGVLGLQEHLIDPGKSEGLDGLLAPIDWNSVDAAIEKEKTRALTWLKGALERPIRVKAQAGPRLDRLEDKARLHENMLAGLAEDTRRQMEELSRQNTKDVILVLSRCRILRKYYWYKLLSKITSGKRRKRYVAKRNLWHDRVRRLRELKKSLKNFI